MGKGNIQVYNFFKNKQKMAKRKIKKKGVKSDRKSHFINAYWFSLLVLFCFFLFSFTTTLKYNIFCSFQESHLRKILNASLCNSLLHCSGWNFNSYSVQAFMSWWMCCWWQWWEHWNTFLEEKINKSKGRQAALHFRN